jgi:hypothetical protein
VLSINLSSHTMALPMLVGGGAECGPSNPLQGLSKRFDQDRGLQQVSATTCIILNGVSCSTLRITLAQVVLDLRKRYLAANLNHNYSHSSVRRYSEPNEAMPRKIRTLSSFSQETHLPPLKSSQNPTSIYLPCMHHFP